MLEILKSLFQVFSWISLVGQATCFQFVAGQGREVGRDAVVLGGFCLARCWV